MGIGFAIPIDMAKMVKGQLMEKGKFTRSWLGVAIQDINDDLARLFKLTRKSGALVTEVSKGSPAEKAGLKKGDVIINLNGRPVTDVTELRNMVAMSTPGTQVELTLVRDEKEQKITAVVEEQPADMTSLAGTSQNQLFQNMGMALQDLTPDIAKQLGYQMNQGVLIASVAPGSAAALAGIKPGSLIEEVNRQSVQNLKQLQQVLEKAAGGQDVLLFIRSGTRSQYVVIGVK